MVSFNTIAALVLIGAFLYFGGTKYLKVTAEAAKEFKGDLTDLAQTIKSKAQTREDEIKETMANGS